jgi:hypothetical protein
VPRLDTAYYAKRLRSTAWRRGLGGSQPYLVLAIVVSSARVLRRIASPKPEVLYRHRLQPGEVWEITARAATDRKAKKA